MEHAGPPTVLPLRPLTVGELLDAAVSLLRANGQVLLPAGLVLATAEQCVLVPLRALTDMDGWNPFGQGFGVAQWLVLCLGAATEVVAIALLGALAARAVGAAVLGHRLPARRLLNPRGSRLGAVSVVAAAAGVVVFLSSLAGPTWAVGYALVGLAVPTVVLDRAGPARALARGVKCACRAGLRAVWIRLLGYLGWFTVRLLLGLVGPIALDGLGVDRQQWPTLLGTAVWVAVNGLAYPALACLDAVTHLEIRTRTEGLDIMLSRARRHGPLTDALLRVGP